MRLTSPDGILSLASQSLYNLTLQTNPSRLRTLSSNSIRMIFYQKTLTLAITSIIRLHLRQTTNAVHEWMMQTMMMICTGIHQMRLHRRLRCNNHLHNNLTNIRTYHHSYRVHLHLLDVEVILHQDLHLLTMIAQGKTSRLVCEHETGYENDIPQLRRLNLNLYHRHLDPEGRTLDNGVFRTITTVMFHLRRLGANRNGIYAVINAKKHKRANHLQMKPLSRKARRQWKKMIQTSS